ncbi:DUF1707 SHOCT-like domain-containing protein [Glycomyces xiaoerkulensis]|uniref:DUF1707 SHOCT-like domain-containing protein n=1 Tax=Glycomyces xiaoerkulensis TaxID=2038139 RepID=UPI0012FFE591|nr:DUF1707 domain-containing protein [Glycomyces xiaoerkulensis]
MSDDRDNLRISNADRDQAVALLQKALDEGRIDLSEFDERTKSAYEAKTKAELDLIFEDLPVDRSADLAVHTIDLTPAERARRERESRRRVRRGAPPILNPLIITACITVTIWGLSSLASWQFQYFWPAWPLGIMGAIAVAQWLTGETDDDDDDDRGGC